MKTVDEMLDKFSNCLVFSNLKPEKSYLQSLEEFVNNPNNDTLKNLKIWEAAVKDCDKISFSTKDKILKLMKKSRDEHLSRLDLNDNIDKIRSGFNSLDKFLSVDNQISAIKQFLPEAIFDSCVHYLPIYDENNRNLITYYGVLNKMIDDISDQILAKIKSNCGGCNADSCSSPRICSFLSEKNEAEKILMDLPQISTFLLKRFTDNYDQYKFLVELDSIYTKYFDYKYANVKERANLLNTNDFENLFYTIKLFAEGGKVDFKLTNIDSKKFAGHLCGVLKYAGDNLSYLEYFGFKKQKEQNESDLDLLPYVINAIKMGYLMPSEKEKNLQNIYTTIGQLLSQISSERVSIFELCKQETINREVQK